MSPYWSKWYIIHIHHCSIWLILSHHSFHWIHHFLREKNITLNSAVFQVQVCLHSEQIREEGRSRCHGPKMRFFFFFVEDVFRESKIFSDSDFGPWSSIPWSSKVGMKQIQNMHPLFIFIPICSTPRTQPPKISFSLPCFSSRGGSSSLKWRWKGAERSELGMRRPRVLRVLTEPHEAHEHQVKMFETFLWWSPVIWKTNWTK